MRTLDDVDARDLPARSRSGFASAKAGKPAHDDEEVSMLDTFSGFALRRGER
jgi:hypothetical protein